MNSDYNEMLIKSPLAVPEKDRVVVFFLEDSGRLTVNILHSASGWEEFETLSKKTVAFTAAYGLDQNYYLVDMDQDHVLKLRIGKPGQWKEETPLKKDQDKIIDGFLILTDYKNCIHLLYLLVDVEAKHWWFIHQRHAEQNWDEPRIIDFGGGDNFQCFHTAVDNWDRLHLVYSIKEENRTPLYTRTFSFSEMSWSRALMLESEQHNLNPFLMEGPDQKLHLTWCSFSDKGYQVRYRQKTPGGWPAGKWSQVINLSDVYEKQAFPFLTGEGGTVKIKWYIANRMLKCLSLQENLNLEKEEERVLEEDTTLLRVISPTEYSKLPRLQYNVDRAQPNLSLEAYKKESMTAEDETELSGFFSKLQEDSVNLFSHLSDLYRTRLELQHKLEGKKQEARWLSHQSRQYLASLQKDLQEKEQQIRQMEENFGDTLAALKQKTQQARRAWDEENMKLLKENQKLKKEKSELQCKLTDRDARLEQLQTEVESLKNFLEDLHTENASLKELVNRKSFSLKDFFSRLTHNKP